MDQVCRVSVAVVLSHLSGYVGARLSTPLQTALHCEWIRPGCGSSVLVTGREMVVMSSALLDRRPRCAKVLRKMTAPLARPAQSTRKCTKNSKLSGKRRVIVLQRSGVRARTWGVAEQQGQLCRRLLRSRRPSSLSSRHLGPIMSAADSLTADCDWISLGSSRRPIYILEDRKSLRIDKDVMAYPAAAALIYTQDGKCIEILGPWRQCGSNFISPCPPMRN